MRLSIITRSDNALSKLKLLDNKPSFKIRPALFQKKILHWFDQNGRKNLPWQKDKNAYRVWISEIMLQQTQVKTVIPFYERFMHRFPTILDLANAEEDEVLHYWTGLGYYTRARSLLKAAKMVKENLKGEFPKTLEAMIQLPGIGRSTAGAILSLTFNQSIPILDGNVKRVFARIFGIVHPIDLKEVEANLWELVNHYMPKKRASDYTQALMDFGATLCKPNPICETCSLTSLCFAFQNKIASLIPYKSKKIELPKRNRTFFVILSDAQFLLQRKPSKGIWGGLWSFPEFEGVLPKKEVIEHFFVKYGKKIVVKKLKPLSHTFTHYKLMMHAYLIDISSDKKTMNQLSMLQKNNEIWYNPHKPSTIGIPAPILKIMKQI